MVVHAGGHATWRAALVWLALLAWPAVQSSAQTLTVDTVGDSLKVRAQGLSFLNGDPLVRLETPTDVTVKVTLERTLPGQGL